MLDVISFAIGVLIGNAILIGLIAGIHRLGSGRKARTLLLIDHMDAIARAGLPLSTGLRMAAGDLGWFLGARVRKAAYRLEEGASLEVALSALPRSVPPIIGRMAALGERSGNLSPFLSELRRSYRRGVLDPTPPTLAFLYPVTVTLTVCVILLGLIRYILPKLDAVMLSLKLPPVAPSVRVLDLGAKGAIALILLLGIGWIYGGAPLRSIAGLSRILRYAADRLVLATPFLGRIVRARFWQVFATSTGLLLRSGATLPEAVRVVAETEPNRVLRRRTLALAGHLEEGGRIPGFPGGKRLIPRSLLWFVEAGEAGGEMAEHLLAAGDQMAERLQMSALVASRMLVPGLVILNGLLVMGVWWVVTTPFVTILEKALPFR
jgi:general secretion pathway protein F